MLLLGVVTREGMVTPEEAVLHLTAEPGAG
jgi:hypothetical protein